MLRGALLPSTLAGVVAAVGVVLWRGADAVAGAGIGLVVSLGFFASGMFLLSRLVRSASAHAFFAVLGAQVVTGPTLTNVNDFRAILLLPPDN